MKTHPVKLFLSYSLKDKHYVDALQTHLQLLENAGIIEKWHDRRITIGEDWRGEIASSLNDIDIILLLVSADFLASEYCYGIELKRALERHEAGDARVIPIIVRECLWTRSPFGKLQALPRDGKAIASWANRDEAWMDVASSIIRVCDEIRRGTIEPSTPKPTRRPKPFQIIPLYNVFKQAGVPTITFIEPARFLHLKQALEQPGRGIVIEGPSGIGKTSALKHALNQINKENLQHVQMLSARLPRDIERISKLTDEHIGLVVIDDFHRLDDTLKVQLSDYIKYLADAEEDTRKLVIIGIPSTGRHLIDMSHDIALRVDIFNLTRVNSDRIYDMIEKGEAALNISFSRKADSSSCGKL